MKKTSLTAEQIVWAMCEREAGVSVHRICAHFDISIATFYNLRKRYEGLDVAAVMHLMELETEKFRLVKLIEGLKEDRTMLQEILEDYLATSSQTRSCSRSL